jgi:hypothetical protein
MLSAAHVSSIIPSLLFRQSAYGVPIRPYHTPLSVVDDGRRAGCSCLLYESSLAKLAYGGMVLG